MPFSMFVTELGLELELEVEWEKTSEKESEKICGRYMEAVAGGTVEFAAGTRWWGSC